MLQIRNLTSVFPTDSGMIKAVNGVDFHLKQGQIVGLVGESGCGKSATMLSILRLLPHPGKIIQGEVLFEGEDLLKKPLSEMRKIRGRKISMIFQDPMTTLNPVFKVGEQIRESMVIHGFFKKDGWNGFDFFRRRRKRKEIDKVISLMEEVGIPSADLRYYDYPHQFSGGMQQRALIAIALACNPRVILADEPTTALDVTIQAQILDLLRRINEEHGTGIILVTHDLGVAAEFCHEIAVMYAGRIVERSKTDDIIEDPKHPYTQGLLKSIPRIVKHKQKLYVIPGSVPDLLQMPPGCAFAPRCVYAIKKCKEKNVPLTEIEEGRYVRCINYI